MRQRVLLLPIPLRLLLAAQPEFQAGCAATLSMRRHGLVLDGAPGFIEASAPTANPLQALLQSIIARFMRMC